MGNHPPTLPENTALGHVAVRLLVSVYTVACATGLIAGTNLSRMLTPFMPGWVAQSLMAIIISTLCVLMLMAVKRRAMALLLALIFLWSSYFAILGPNAANLGGSHWRDMILVGALLLIYSDKKYEMINDITVLTELVRRPAEFRETLRPITPDTGNKPNIKLRRTSQTTLFREDLDNISTH